MLISARVEEERASRSAARGAEAHAARNAEDSEEKDRLRSDRCAARAASCADRAATHVALVADSASVIIRALLCTGRDKDNVYNFVKQLSAIQACM